jgi:hypothetical protein
VYADVYVHALAVSCLPRYFCLLPPTLIRAKKLVPFLYTPAYPLVFADVVFFSCYSFFQIRHQNAWIEHGGPGTGDRGNEIMIFFHQRVGVLEKRPFKPRKCFRNSKVLTRTTRYHSTVFAHRLTTTKEHHFLITL